MLQVQFLRENKEKVLSALKIKNFHNVDIIDNIIDLDNKRKSVQSNIDDLLSQSNSISKKVAIAFKEKKGDADALRRESLDIKQKIKEIQLERVEIENNMRSLLVQVPNVPNDIVPPGKSEKDNEIVNEFGVFPNFKGKKYPHWDLCKKYDIVNFDLGNKITGSGFPVYTDRGAKLQRSLISFFLEQNISSGYIEYLPPHLVNEDSGFGTGQLPKFEEDLYKIPSDNNMYLIPTAEVPVTNFFRDTIVNIQDLPIKCTAYTPCFRKEAGSYGKEVRGLNRLHQFDKVEIVQITHPKDSYLILDEMVSHVSSLLDKLELPYRILKLCGGDLGFSASLTYDLEVYSAGQERWLEVSSVSNFENYQSNRLKLRYKDDQGKNRLCHTLNGSALALPRIFAAIIENNQTESGINIPKALQSYTGFDIID